MSDVPIIKEIVSQKSIQQESPEDTFKNYIKAFDKDELIATADFVA